MRDNIELTHPIIEKVGLTSRSNSLTPQRIAAGTLRSESSTRSLSSKRLSELKFMRTQRLKTIKMLKEVRSNIASPKREIEETPVIDKEITVPMSKLYKLN